jgi:hypothetical protein
MKKIIVLISFFLMLSTCFMQNANAVGTLGLIATSPDYTQTMKTVVADDYYVYAGGSNINTVTKYNKNTLDVLGTTASIGGSVSAITEDTTSLYVCGFSNKVYQISKSTLATTASSAALAASYSCLSDDATYVYVGSDAGTRVYKLFKSNMTQQTVTADLTVSVYSVCDDANYVYAGGNGKLWQFYKGNMTTKVNKAVNSVYSITQDLLYVYTGDSAGNIKQYWKSNMTEKQTVAYGGIVYGVSIDDTCIFAGGATTVKARQYYISNFTLIAESASYGGTINAVANDDDNIYVCGATTRKVYSYLKEYVAPSTNGSSSYIEGSLYVCFFDSKTGTPLNYYRNSWTGTKYDSYLQGGMSIISHLGTGNYTNVASDWFIGYSSTIGGYSPEQCNDNYWTVWLNDGGNNTINVYGSSGGNIKGVVDGSPVVWREYWDYNTVLYDGESISVFLIRVDAIDDINVIEDKVDEYNDTFGDFFIEFYNYEEGCEYRIGYNPIFIYQLNDTLFNDTDGYIWRLYDANAMKRAEGKITFHNGSVFGVITVDYWSFFETGEYYVMLFNIDSDGIMNELLYTSTSITVCDKAGSSTIVIDFSTIPTMFKLLVSLLIIITLTITPYALASFINRGNVEIKMPGLVYIAFFFLGIAVSVLLGLLDAWIFVIIFFGIIITIALLWLRGQSEGE